MHGGGQPTLDERNGSKRHEQQPHGEDGGQGARIGPVKPQPQCPPHPPPKRVLRLGAGAHDCAACTRSVFLPLFMLV